MSRTKIYWFFPLLSIICLTILFTQATPGSSQYGSSWAPYDRAPGYSDDTVPPIMIADQNKTIHAFASQWVGEESPQLAIVYRKWTLDLGWTAPVDILVNQEQNNILGAFLDNAGVIHIIYFGGFGSMGMAGNIYYSQAPAASADQVKSWSAPEAVGENAIVPPAASAAIAGDKNGKLVVVYSGSSSGSGIYVTYSYDHGTNWSAPILLFQTKDPGAIPFCIQLFWEPSGWLHAIWNTIDTSGMEITLYYARMDTQGMEWSKPTELAKRLETGTPFGPGFPILAAAKDYMVVMYNAATLENPDYPVMAVTVSKDDGQTWSDPYTPFPEIVGRSGYHALVVDGENVVHAIFNQRIEHNVNGRYQTTGGIFHTEFAGTNWTEPQVIFNPKNFAPYDIRAVVSQGNELLVTWREDPGAGHNGVWYSFTTLDAPQLPLEPLPVPTSRFQNTPTKAAVKETPTAILVPSPEIDKSFDVQQGKTLPFGSSTAIIIGIIPAALLILLVFIIRKNRM